MLHLKALGTNTSKITKEMRTKFISALGLVLLMASCVEENFNEFNDITPTPGKDIVFSANINTPKTRTVYGVEVDTDGDEVKDQIKVKWVHGDLVTVYGTACADGRQQADYAVQSFVKDADGNPTTEVAPSTPNTNDGYSYADDLVKSGAYGVQWGESPTSDFYAVYPAVEDGAFEAIVDENNVVTGVTVASKINAQQYLSFTSGTTAVTGIPYNSTGKAYGMNDALMYAYTPNATPTDANGNPKKVDLNFRPFSTVLNFSIPSWEAETNSGLKTEGSSIAVNSITLTAPYGIAGDFDLQVKNNGTASAGEGSSKTITIYPAGQLKWDFGKSLEFSVFTIPVDGKNMGTWTVSIELANQDENGSYITKNFTFSPANANTGVNNSVLAAGMIHKINVPSAFAVDAVWNYSPKNWLTTIPRNVYIADLSLPGSWYATDSGYQSGSLADQYAAGIRAFNIDCRLTLNNKSIREANGSSGMTYRDSEAHVTDGTLALVCSGTESGLWGRITKVGTTVKSAIQTIGKLAAENTEEYVEIIITVAQKPKTQSGYTYGTVNAKMMYTAICDLLNDSALAEYIYSKPITPNTILTDVLGKVVVKVNMNTDNSNLSTWNIAAPALFSEGTMAESADASRYIKQANFTTMNSPAMYWSNSFNPTVDNAMVFHYHQAQNTTGTSPFPTVANRKTAIESILSQSYAEYSSNEHNGWYQLGIGGWTDDSDKGKEALSAELKPYVYGIINSMLTRTAYNGKTYEPAPVGAVLMNHSTATTNKTADLIKAIIDLNGAYFLNRDTTQPAWPTDIPDEEGEEGGEI